MFFARIELGLNLKSFFICLFISFIFSFVPPIFGDIGKFGFFSSKIAVDVFVSLVF